MRSWILAFALVGCATSANLAPSARGDSATSQERKASLSPVPCSQLTTLRALHRQIQVVKNARTGNSIEYVVLGDGAVSDDVLVYFPGTGQIVPGWPNQLITNSKYSPKIVKTFGYRADEDGNVSLCHDYRLVFFDYPGVGITPSSTFTKDDVADDVDATLQDISTKFGISTARVDPIGWSLGTTNALKYAFLSPASRPARQIHNVILYSAHGGGSEQAGGSGQASCVKTLFDATLTTGGKLGTKIKLDLTKLIFPFKGQTPEENGTRSTCRAKVTKKAILLTVVPVCTIDNGCSGYIYGYFADIRAYPWRRTKGIDDQVYTQERQQSGDWDVAYCARALPRFTSGACTAYGPIQQSPTNGGICKTDTSNPDKPVSIACNKLKISGKVTVLDGFEDLLVQWTYDKALADGLNAVKPKSASLYIYPGSTGHGILIQHPRWVQSQTAAAMQH